MVIKAKVGYRYEVFLLIKLKFDTSMEHAKVNIEINIQNPFLVHSSNKLNRENFNNKTESGFPEVLSHQTDG